VAQVLEYRAREQCEPLRYLFRTAMMRFSSRQVAFFDETHTAPNDLRRKYGLSYKGLPAFYYVDRSAHGQGTGCTALCALSLFEIFSVTTSTAKIDNAFFIHTLEYEVLPKMSRYPLPNSVLILDNASQHNPVQVQLLCAQFGVLCLFLPPYSYDYNPIELCFHEAKFFIRSRWGLADGDTEERLYDALTKVGLTNESIAHYYMHCGYEVSQADIAWVEEMKR